MEPADSRLIQLTQWARSLPGLADSHLTVASADASFRRYFRMSHGSQHYILMDAPPGQEDITPFIDVTRRLEKAGLPVPHIHAMAVEQGFLMLTDFGDRSLLSCLTSQTVEHWYQQTLDLLIPLQTASTRDLPRYDDPMLQREMALFSDWFLKQHLNIDLSAIELQSLEQVFDILSHSAREQPQVFVHRDYHSRNLMIVNGKTLGIIDYQDAVLGPVTYDAVSLLRDCYIAWPLSQTHAFALSFKQKLDTVHRLPNCSDTQFLRWFDLMGCQRHLKAIGIFARLNHRDGKPGYLGDIPRTLGYVLQVAKQHEDLSALAELIARHRLMERMTT
ncbi:unnamed protein product [Cyprideis torosa]|uniref:Aminoglycoside phosphotransferase domain-containing protein n=1 Tax=Cyprideis torosa TaxID=163714 RepID=A0A7R8WTQ0_9CRUS|nr:unnamed protein product [Cyprideis torosa]CAG0910056.1 unnamed protein product [Cyprideis torosa]